MGWKSRLIPVFVLASWSEMKEAKAKGLDVPSFYYFSCNTYERGFPKSTTCFIGLFLMDTLRKGSEWYICPGCCIILSK